MREKRDIRPVLFKLGFALAISFGGILCSILKHRRMRPPSSGQSQSPDSDFRNQADLGEDLVAGLKKDDFLTTPSSCNHSLTAPQEIDDHPTADLSPNGQSNADKEEIERLRKTVNTLEMKLLEYYGVKEQESAVLELQNRLKINNMEAKLLKLKIESLKSDNQKLVAKMSDYPKIVKELEDSRAKIGVLKKKLEFEADHNKKLILNLQERVMKFQEQEQKSVLDLGLESNHGLNQKVKILEEELEELRKSNHGLRLENSNLVQKLDYSQKLANSDRFREENDHLRQENDHFRQENEDLTKEMERIQSDRCADVEELVYLRWVNACLRYELRNYRPTPEKTIARDLSKSLSPESEAKAKNLILEYANKESSKSVDFDFDQWSFPEASDLTDSGEIDDLSVDDSSVNKTNSSSRRKVFSKLIGLIRGKDHVRRNSDEGLSWIHRIIDDDNEEKRRVEERANFLKSDLAKYAGVLKDSRGRGSKFRPRSVSYS